MSLTIIKFHFDYYFCILDNLTNFAVLNYLIGMDIAVYDNRLPEVIKVEDKTATEKIQLISMLNEDDKNAVYRIIDGMLTKTKFQTFFEQNIVTK